MKATFLKGVALGSAVSLATLAATAAFAGTGVGNVFNLGQANRVNTRSQLEGKTPSAVLNVTNSDKSGSASGVSIDVPGSDPPLVVNSATKVKNLNADLLDGRDASQFQHATSQSCANGTAITSIAANGAASCHTTVLPIDSHQPEGDVTGSTDVLSYVPSSISLTFQCVVPGLANLFVSNTGAAPATLTSVINSMGDNPTDTSVEDIQPGARVMFNTGALLVAHFIYFDETTVTTLDFNDASGADDCEQQGTVAIAQR